MSTVCARVLAVDGACRIALQADGKLEDSGIAPGELVEVSVVDRRLISAKQREAICATVHDIACFLSGYAWKRSVLRKTLAEMELSYVIDRTDSEEIRYTLTRNYCRLTETPFFSLSQKEPTCASVTLAHDFLGWLIDLCVEQGIPTNGRLIDRAEDIGRYLYSCLAHKRCAVCGAKADLHHVDAVGMGRNRREITHLGMRAESLCRVHHEQAHSMGQTSFDNHYHFFGIAMDDTLCEIHHLKH